MLRAPDAPSAPGVAKSLYSSRPAQNNPNKPHIAMKKTDLEKFKAKKLDIRKSQEATPDRFGAASIDKGRHAPSANSLLGKLLSKAADKPAGPAKKAPARKKKA